MRSIPSPAQKEPLYSILNLSAYQMIVHVTLVMGRMKKSYQKNRWGRQGEDSPNLCPLWTRGTIHPICSIGFKAYFYTIFLNAD